MSGVQEPKFKVLQKWGNIESREYPRILIAEVKTSGTRQEAINEGFKKLADYIFGGNQSAEKMQMMAPVFQENIGDNKHWKIAFVMPASYNPQTLPSPNDSSIRLLEITHKKFISIRFSGLVTDENIKSNLELLKKFITEHQLQILGEPVFAFYNPPWTLPFLKRNEVMFELK